MLWVLEGLGMLHWGTHRRTGGLPGSRLGSLASCGYRIGLHETYKQKVT